MIDATNADESWMVHDNPGFARPMHGPEIWTSGGMLIARVAGLAGFDYANARKIAVLPDLFAACKAIVAARRGGPYKDAAEYYRHLDAAIAMAEAAMARLNPVPR